MLKNKIKFCEYGLPYYDFLPDNTRVAIWSDFFKDDEPIISKPFLIKSFVKKDVYWANRVKENFPILPSDLIDFINLAHVYIFTDK